jgi:tRNA threonylcarbamoyladenosine biosynthesis protein TsaB
MLVLAIDTALEHCAAAVLDSDAGNILSSETLVMSRGHAEALMPLVMRVMEESKTPFEKLDRIAVTTGPGSFTGLRVGISAARGIGLAAQKEVVGVTTLSAYAAAHVADNGSHPILAAIDARHDQVYFQAVSGNGATLIRPRLSPMFEALRAARFGAPRIVGNNAADSLAQRWPSEGLAPVSVEAAPGPDISWVAWLGVAATPGKAPAKPLYLKAADAKISATAMLPQQS